MVALCLLQGWFVIDHFGHVLGTLGITTAKDSDAQAAEQFANVSLDLPADWQATAQAQCAMEWPADYNMRNYCVQQQNEGAQTLANGSQPGVEAGAFRVMRGTCAKEWPTDFRMRAYCEAQQFEGYRALGASATGDSTRNACAQQWPSDYNMRQYCESKGR